VWQEDVTLLTKRKRGGDQEFGSEDSDDGFGRAPGPGGKAVRFARSTAGSVGGRSRASNGSFGGKSLGNKSVRSSASKRSAASAKESHHSGNRCLTHVVVVSFRIEADESLYLSLPDSHWLLPVVMEQFPI
jgi:hypothetical protein